MAEPTGEHVERGGKTGGLNAMHYDATSSAPVAGYVKLDDRAGTVGSDHMGHGHFSDADSHGAGANHPGPWKQV